FVAAVGAALVLFLGSGLVAQAQTAQRGQQQVEIDYRAPKNAAFQPIREGLKKYAVLERLANFLSPLRLPANQKLALLFDECGAETKPYMGDGVVVICYELQKKIEEIAIKVPKKETQEAVQRIATTMPFNDQQRDFIVRFGTLIQVALHGVATAVFDIFKVPVWGESV